METQIWSTNKCSRRRSCHVNSAQQIIVLCVWCQFTKWRKMAIYLEDYKDWISTFATIATICQFLTGSKICRDFMRKGSTGEVSGMPLVVGALNSCCWFRYSLLINDTALIIVNGTGACLNTIWTVAYYLYTQRKFLIQIQVLPCNFVNVCISSNKCCSC